MVRGTTSVSVRFKAARCGRRGGGGEDEVAGARELDDSEVRSVLDVLRAPRESEALLVSPASPAVARWTGGFAVSSMLSGLSERSAMKPLSKGLSPDMSAGPVTGPSAPKPWAPVPSWPMRFARVRSSIMLCTSWSPLSLAWAFAIPGLVAAQPSLSRINSMERFSTFWRLWMNSSDCVANENECSDSEGKRERSSPKANVGEAGAVGVDSEGCLDTGGVVMFSEVAR